MLKRSLLVYLFLLHFYLIFPQPRLLESQIEEAIHLLDSGKYQEIIPIASRTLQDSDSIDYKKGIAASNFLLGIANNALRSREKAIDYLQQALTDSMYLDKDHFVRLKVSLGDYYAYKSAYELSERYYKQALSYYRNEKNDSMIIHVLTSLGGLYINMGNYLEGGEQFEEAYYLSLEKQIYTDMGWIFNGLSAIYRKYKNRSQAKKLGYEAIKMYETTPELLKYRGRGYYNLGQLFYETQEYDSAVILFKLALEHSDNPIFDLTSLANISNGYLSLKQIDSAEKYVERGLSVFRKRFPNKEYSFHPYKARIHLERNNLDSAEYYANSYLKNASNEGHEETYKLLYELSKKRKNYERALYYHEKHRALQDSVLQKTKDEEFASFRVRIETIEKEKEINELKSEAAINRLTVILILVASLSIFIILIILFRLYRLNAKRKQLKVELERNKMKLELEHSQRELSEYTFSLIRKNTLLNELMDTAKHEARRNSNNWNKIIRIIDKSRINEKDWEDFSKYFGAIHNDFFDRLKNNYPLLSKNEMRQAALIRMNLTLKESAEILGVDPNSIKVARFRMKKKLGLNKEANLNDAILSI